MPPCQAPSRASVVATSEQKKNCNRPDGLPVIISRSEKKISRIQNETNYEKKYINVCSRRCDSAWRLCCCTGTTGSWWCRVLAWTRIRPKGTLREIEPD